MADSWDVFHSETLSVDRAVPDATVRARLRAGTLTPDDLVRPAGTTRWSRIEQVAALAQDPVPAPPAEATPPLALLPLAPAPEPEPEPPAAPSPPHFDPPSIAGELARPGPAAPGPTPPAAPGLDSEFPDEMSTVEFRAAGPPEASIPVEPVSLGGSIEAAPVLIPPPPPAPRPQPRPRPRPAVPAGPPESSGSVEAAPVFEPPPAARPEPPDVGGSAVEVSPIFEPIILPDDEDEEGPPAHPDDLADPEPTELEGAGDDEDEDAASFTLSRGGTETVEELDLAAMVDVAFQLVLFFLVTASTVVFKTLEIPKPSEDKPPEVAAQSRAKTLDELEKDFILLEIDAEGNFKVDHLPVAGDRAALTEKLRQAREATDRRALLLSTDPATRHRVAVLASDIAREVNLEVSWAKAAQP